MEDYSIDDAGAGGGHLPDFLTVEEAAAVLRIGRTAAYEATRRYRATGGAEGIPVYKVGGTLRVPRHKLEEIAGGPIEIPTDHVPSPSTQTRRSIDDRPAPAATPRRRRTNGDRSVQQTLHLIP